MLQKSLAHASDSRNRGPTLSRLTVQKTDSRYRGVSENQGGTLGFL